MYLLESLQIQKKNIEDNIEDSLRKIKETLNKISEINFILSEETEEGKKEC